MKRRWIWIGLTVVPLLLLGVTLWTRKVAWGQMEEKFRQDMVADAIQYNDGRSSMLIAVSVDTSSSKYSHLLDLLSAKQMKTFWDDVHLVPASQSPRTWTAGSLYSLYYGSEMSSYYGVWLDIKQDSGEFGFSDDRLQDKWRLFRISPESCHALKRHLWSQYGAKLRSLHVPPPQ